MLEAILENAIAGLAVSALGAICVVAFKSPKIYKKVYTILQVILITILFGCMIWNFSADQAARNIYTADCCKKDSITAIVDAAHASTLPWYGFAVMIAVSFFLSVLTALPGIVEQMRE